MPSTFQAFCLTLLLTACSSTGQSGNDNTQTAALANVAEATASVPSGSGECLVSHANKGTLDQLLPLDAIKKHYNVPAQAKKNYSYRPEAKTHDRDTYEYVWDSDRVRKMKILGREQEYPASNRVGLRWVGSDLFMMSRKTPPLDNFRAFYRNTTAAEKDAAFKKAGEQMKQQGYDAQKVEAAKGMGKDLAADDIMFKDIPGIGDAASWRIKDKELTVLVGKVTFQVVAEISANDDENIALAKKIAAEVLAVCK
jgi:hypothetical protein